MSSSFKKFLTITISLIIIFVLIILAHFTIPIILDFFRFIVRLIGPFIAGFIFAYLLVNIVDFLESKGVSRILAVSLVFIVFISVLVFAVISLIPILINQIGEFVKEVPGLLDEIDTLITKFFTQFDFIPDKYRFNMSDLGNYIINMVDLSPSINLSGIFSAFSVIFLTPVATFYFLMEYHSIKSFVKRILRRNKMKFFHRYLHDLDEGMGQYLKGLVLIINILAILASISFMIVDLDYPILFGFLVGYLDVIPYIGPFIGGAPAALYAFTISPKLGILVLIILIVLQILGPI